jgi:hypothetical protein
MTWNLVDNVRTLWCVSPTLLSLPDGELVEVGLRDLAAGNVTDESLLVSIGRPRLVQLGLDVPAGFDNAEHRLYGRRPG